MRLIRAPNPWRLPRRRDMALMLLLLVTACSGATGGAIARGAPDSLAPLVKKVLPAVVNIAVTETVSGGDMLNELPSELQDTPLGREFRRRYGNRHEQVSGAGSGFIVDSVSEVLKIPHSAIGPTPKLSDRQERIISRVANLERQKRMVLLIDVDHLLEPNEINSLANAAA